jgi:hypothetical protein
MAPRSHDALGALERQLRNEFCAFETAVARWALAMPPAVVEIFIERAIDEILVEFARSTTSPSAPMVHAALGRRLREGVQRRLEGLRGSSEL